LDADPPDKEIGYVPAGELVSAVVLIEIAGLMTEALSLNLNPEYEIVSGGFTAPNAFYLSSAVAVSGAGVTVRLPVRYDSE
jgi:hypothetical protein